jgi:hypothetical protein
LGLTLLFHFSTNNQRSTWDFETDFVLHHQMEALENPEYQSPEEIVAHRGKREKRLLLQGNTNGALHAEG